MPDSPLLEAATATAAEYRRSINAGAERVASRVAAVTGPFTGVTPAELEPVVGEIDLDRPLADRPPRWSNSTASTCATPSTSTTRATSRTSTARSSSRRCDAGRALERKSGTGARPYERVMTMAALLHVDRDGEPLAATLIAESGREAREWLRAYLDAYLVPVLHSFCAYGLVYMPHGENVILVLDDAGIVRRVLFKDIAEEIAVLDPATPLPPGVERICAEVPDELRVLSIFTDVFDCFLGFRGAILDGERALSEREFWEAVADCVNDYRAANSAFADRFEAYDLFVERFPLSCLNRLQLRDNRQMVDLDDPASALQLAGTLENPIAKRRLRGA